MSLLDLVRAAFPERPWRLSRPLGRRRGVLLVLGCVAWIALWIGVFDAHWVHRVASLRHTGAPGGPCATGRWDVWAIFAVAITGAGTGYLAYRATRNHVWVSWLAVGGAAASALGIEAITGHTWASEFRCYD